MKAIAIDFETANEERGSACSVGLAFIEAGRVVRVEERFIKPKTMRFSPFNIAVHGIRPEDVEDAGEFPEVMDEFADEFHGAALIAHNAAFDFSVWRASLDQYRLGYPSLDYVCSVKLSQKVWPDLPSHKLNVLARHLGIGFNHHRAGEDAAVCAEATIAMARAHGKSCVLDLARSLGLTPGSLHRSGYTPCSVAKPARRAL